MSLLIAFANSLFLSVLPSLVFGSSHQALRVSMKKSLIDESLCSFNRLLLFFEVTLFFILEIITFQTILTQF